MNGEAMEYRIDDNVMLNITRVGNRSWAGNLELGAGDAVGNVAGASDGATVFEAPLVRAILMWLSRSD